MAADGTAGLRAALLQDRQSFCGPVSPAAGQSVLLQARQLNCWLTRAWSSPSKAPHANCRSYANAGKEEVMPPTEAQQSQEAQM